MTALRPPRSDTKRRRSAAALTASLTVLTAPLLSIYACADSSPTSATELEAGSVLPSPDTSLADAHEEDVDEAPVPCAAGNLCRVPIPLTVGSVTSMNGRSKHDVWAAASRGVLMHWDGAQWVSVESGISEALSSLFLTSDALWATAGTLVFRRQEGDAPARTFRVDERFRSVSGVGVLSTGDVYLSYLAYPGGVWTVPVTPDSSLGKITSFDAGTVSFAPDPVFPGTAQKQPLSTRALFVVPDKALWLVGDHATVARYPISPLGAGVVVPVESQANLFSAWGEGDHLWTAGSGGTILHFDGSDWHVEDTGTTVTLNAIFGISPSDVWAVGNEGAVLHFDGNRWSKIDVGRYDGNLQTVWGSSSDDVWIGGENVMFHWGALQ